MIRLTIPVLFGFGVLFSSCTERTMTKRPGVDLKQPEVILAQVLDTSGSFEEKLFGEDALAFNFFTRTSKLFFEQQYASSNSRMVLAQLSATQDSILLDSPPAYLKQKFKSAEAFQDFVQSKAKPEGSRVHTALSQTIQHVLRISNGHPETRIWIVVMSDLDSNTEDAAMEQETIRAFRQLANTNSVLALYWVHDVDYWTQLAESTGVNYVITSKIEVEAPLPLFRN